MKRLSLSARVTGVSLALAGLLLAGCGPRTPNAAAETPFNPTPGPTSAATNPPAIIVDTPAATFAPDSYPGEGIVPPPTTEPLPGYPPLEATAAVATTDPGAPTATAAPPTETVPPAPTATLEPVFITYRDFEIVPASSTAKVGQQVIFLIQSESGAFHQPYAGAAAPFIFEAPPNMGHGVSWPITFESAQTLTILCGYHPNMTGTLTIEP